MPRDLKQEIKDLKVQRWDLTKKLEEEEMLNKCYRTKVNSWKRKFYNLKDKIHALSTIKSSELGSDSD